MTGTYDVTTRSPVVRVEGGPWLRWVDLSGGAGIMGTVTFDAEVHWVRETTSRVSTLDSGGREVSRGSTHNDFYGFATSFESLVDEAREVALRMGLGPGGAARVVVTCAAEDVPLLPAGGGPAPAGCRRYRTPPGDWARADDPAMAERVALAAAGGRGERVLVPAYVGRVAKPVATLWSSSTTEGAREFAEMVDGTWRTVSDGLPPEVADPARDRYAAWVANGMSER